MSAFDPLGTFAWAKPALPRDRDCADYKAKGLLGLEANLTYKKEGRVGTDDLLATGAYNSHH
jgi:hypothetical protein